MTPAPIRNLSDARAVTDAGVGALDAVRAWIGDHGGPDLAGDLKQPLVDIAWRFDSALHELRDRDPDLDANDERDTEE